MKVAKARKEKREKEAEYMAAVRFEPVPEKRRIHDILAEDEGSDAEGTDARAALKKIRTSESGEWRRQSHSTVSTPAYGPSQISTPALMGPSTSARTPFMIPPTPRLRPVTIADSIEDIESSINPIRYESPYGSHDIHRYPLGGLRNDNPYNSRDIHRSPLGDLPYGHLIDHIRVPEATRAQELINDMRRRRRQGRAGINFDIHVDQRDKQVLLKQVHRRYSGRSDERFSSPSEDKENSDESLGMFEDVDLRDDGRRPGRPFQDVVADEEEEDYDMAEVDEDEDMLDDSDAIVTSDDSAGFSEYVLPSSDSSFNDGTPYTAPTTRAVWRHSASAANRGRVFYRG